MDLVSPVVSRKTIKASSIAQKKVGSPQAFRCFSVVSRWFGGSLRTKQVHTSGIFRQASSRQPSARSMRSGPSGGRGPGTDREPADGSVGL